MSDNLHTAARSAVATKARIIKAAQQVFSQKGYAQAGLREIAKQADVAGSLVIKYFKTKSNLFEQALTEALIDPKFFQSDRSQFGKVLIETLNNDSQGLVQPAMIALSIGDEEAKEAIARVSKQFVLEPMADWLGGADGLARAKFILMLTMGYLILAQHIKIDENDAAKKDLAALVEKELQDMVDCN